jgi:hypothetical protein
MGQREMRGAVRYRKRGSGEEIHRRRDRHHRGSVEHDLLGVTAAGAQYREDAFSYPQVADGSAGLDDLAGGFKPGRKGKLRLDLVAAANHQRVGKLTPAARTRMRT